MVLSTSSSELERRATWVNCEDGQPRRQHLDCSTDLVLAGLHGAHPGSGIVVRDFIQKDSTHWRATLHELVVLMFNGKVAVLVDRSKVNRVKAW